MPSYLCPLMIPTLQIRGRRVPIREYSFLDNPRTPREVKAEALVVKVAQGPTGGAAEAKYSAAVRLGVGIPPFSALLFISLAIVRSLRPPPPPI